MVNNGKEGNKLSVVPLESNLVPRVNLDAARHCYIVHVADDIVRSNIYYWRFRRRTADVCVATIPLESALDPDTPNSGMSICSSNERKG